MFKTLLGLLIAGGLWWRSRKDDKPTPAPGPTPTPPPNADDAPAWFSAEAYREFNEDVADAGVNPWRHYVDYGRVEKRLPYRGVDGPIDLNTLPRGRWMYLDDMVTSLVGKFSGDPNGPQDLLFMLGTAIFNRSLPLLVGVTATRNGRDRSVTQKIMDLAKLKIRVEYGTLTPKMANSRLADVIAAESQKGPLNIVVGGTITDVAQALAQGANGDNITVYCTLYGTSNEEGDKAAAQFIRGRCKVVNIGSPEYQTLLWEMARPGNIDERKLIEKYRYIPAWDAVFTPEIMRRSSELNLFQFKHDLPLRLSDYMNVDRMFGGGGDYQGYKQYVPSVRRAEIGLKLLGMHSTQ